MLTESNQRCEVRSLYRIWFAYAAGSIALAALGKWIVLPMWVAGVPVGKWLQMRYYRYLSPWLGYGKLEEDRKPLVALRNHSAARVTFYRALGCPFCPIVRERLQTLQKQMGFDLQTVDVTLQPQLLTKLGLRSVPVVDVEGRRLVGNATSEQLAELIAPQVSVEAAG